MSGKATLASEISIANLKEFQYHAENSRCRRRRVNQNDNPKDVSSALSILGPLGSEFDKTLHTWIQTLLCLFGFNKSASEAFKILKTLCCSKSDPSSFHVCSKFFFQTWAELKSSKDTNEQRWQNK